MSNATFPVQPSPRMCAPNPLSGQEVAQAETELRQVAERHAALEDGEVCVLCKALLLAASPHKPDKPYYV